MGSLFDNTRRYRQYAAAWNQAMPDKNLHAHVWGNGNRSALLLHGQFGDVLMWREIAPRIAAAGYRVITPDLPGHGRLGRVVGHRRWHWLWRMVGTTRWPSHSSLL